MKYPEAIITIIVLNHSQNNSKLQLCYWQFAKFSPWAIYVCNYIKASVPSYRTIFHD